MRSLVLAVAVHSASSFADEGMWTFDNLPTAQMKAAYGFVPDQAWLDRARRATLSIGGCTASFVSSDGLVMANHHCVEGCLRTLSAQRKKDFRELGFRAKSRAEEAECPGSEALELVSMEDVTEKISAATKHVTPDQFHAAQVGKTTELEGSCMGNEPETVMCEVVDLYHGGQYVLHKYRRYTSLKLVFTPELSIASFGGDPDNFNFPRFSLDLAFLRVYVNGQPHKPEAHFGWRSTGATPGEPVFVTGHPGSTDRLRTVAELEDQRDVALPLQLEALAYERGTYHELARESAHLKEISAAPLARLENRIKVIRGEREALLDPRFWVKKRAEEHALRAAVAKNAGLVKEIGDPWADIAAVLAKDRSFDRRRRALSFATQVRLMDAAQTLVRAAFERPKPNSERLPEYADAQLPGRLRRLLAPRPFYPELIQRDLETALYQMREELGPDDATVKAVLGSKSPASLARQVVAGTTLSDPKARKALWDGGETAIRGSKDPAIRLALMLDPELRAIRKRFEAERSGPLERASERVAKAFFAVKGRSTSPDATKTLRLSYGAVKGWRRLDGVDVSATTTLQGAFDRATGEEPFLLPGSWLKAKPTLELTTPFNFVTDNDIVGGNSGSPMLDKDLQVVGLAFDGNLDSIGGTYWFDAERNRCVGVHPAAIEEALRKIYGLAVLADELGK